MAWKSTKQIFPSEAALYDHSISLLAYKMRTVAELKKLLRSRAPADEMGSQWIENVIKKLKAQNYLNDTRYAEAYIRFRQEGQKLGSRRIVQDLKTKGVHQDVIQKEIRTAFADTNEKEQILAHLARKRIPWPADEKSRARVYRRLQRAGFGASVILAVLKQGPTDLVEHMASK